MKTRITLFIAISAIITLSFTVIKVKSPNKTETPTTATSISQEPIGGFISEEKL